MRRTLALLLLAAAGSSAAPPAPVASPATAPRPSPAKPDARAAAAARRAADRWVKKTLASLTLDEKIGQLVVPGLNGVYTPVDSDAYEKLDRLVREGRVGGFHVFGGAEPLPSALLNPVYGTSGGRATKANPLAVAVLLNHLQRTSKLPLLFTADFEGGAGYIVDSATRLPRAMALGASRDAALAERAGELAAREGRSLGVHVFFYPVVDVNNNPRNPVINVRSFGEDPALVAEMGVAYMKGIQKGGMLSTAKHFPGHGDTAVDTHLDLAVVDKPRAALDAVELVPFKATIAAGIDAVMSTHIRMPALDPTPGRPATLSRPILTGLLRKELGFDGLVFTDSMSMKAIGKGFGDEAAAGLAVAAGVDVVLDPPDPEAALRGIRAAIDRGEIAKDEVDRSVERILRAKAKLGLERARLVDVEAVPASLGGRKNTAVAEEVAARAITLVKDDRSLVPLRPAPGTKALLLSLVDYASGWREGPPGRLLIPELKKRFPDLVAVEVNDRATAGEVDLVKALARRSDVVIAATFVRVASASGRMDLSPAQEGLVSSLAADEKRPFVAIAFGNPYVAALAPKVPAMMLTYELGDAPEVAAVRALVGEAPIGGKLPISIPGLFPVGHGLAR